MAVDTAQYNFETSSQSWASAAGATVAFTTVARSTDQHHTGIASLAGTVRNAVAADYILEVAPPVPAIPGGATVTFQVFVPSSAVLNSIQPYVLDGSNFIGTFVPSGSIARNAWTTVKVVVPSNAVSVSKLGVQFKSTGSWNDVVYVDSISW